MPLLTTTALSKIDIDAMQRAIAAMLAMLKHHERVFRTDFKRRLDGSSPRSQR